MAFSFYWEIITGAGTTSLQQGDVGVFMAKKVISSAIQSVTLPVVNTNDRFSTTFSEADEARLYFNGEYVFGGHINRIQRSFNWLHLRIEGYTGMLKWARTNGDTFTAKEGHDMLNEASVGLIKKYYEDDSDRKTIYSANEVDGTAQDTFDFDTDGETVYDAVKKISQQNRRGSGSVPYDFWVDYSTGSSQIELYFDVKNRAASGVSLYSGTDFFNDYKKKNGDLDNVYNSIVVRGDDRMRCPVDGDWWTESKTDMFTGVTNCSMSTDTSLPKIGANYLRMDIDHEETTAAFYLNLEDTDAVDGSTPSVTPSDRFTSGSGYKYDSTTEKHLIFYIRVDASLQAELDGGDARYIHVVVEMDSDANKLGIRRIFNNTTSFPEFDSVYGIPFADKWYKVDLKLEDLVEDDTVFISEIGWRVSYDVGIGVSDDMYIDGVQLVDYKIIETAVAEDATSITAYDKRSLIYRDLGLTSLALAEDKRDQLLALYKNADNKVVLNLISPRLLSEIDVGETFIVYSNDIAGATYRLVEVQYSNGGQKLVGQLSTVYVDQGQSLTTFTKNIDTNVKNVQRK